MPRGKPIEPFFPDIPPRVMTVEIARMLWTYDPDTGLFTWNVSPHHHISAGDPAGVINVNGYRTLCFKKKKYGGSRIAWLMVTGEWPKAEIDHIDCNPANNRWNNLRPATPSQNKCNLRTRKDNALGIKGVCRTKYGFTAYICIQGKRKNLGTHATAAEAKAVYDATALEWHREFHRAA